MTKQGALEELISSMFNDAELRSFLGQMADTAPLLAGIPGASASPLQVMFETIRILDRHGIIDGEFFRALAAARPRLRQKIQEVAVIWGLTLPAGSESLVPRASSPTPPTAGSTVSPTTVMLSTLAAATPLPADVAILIALEEEWEVFWPIAGEPGGVKDDSGGYLYHFEVPSLGRPYRCVALFMGAMGPGQATQATARLLATRPKTLVNLGIAAAIHDDLKLCDVVVAEQVDDFLSTVKVVPEGPGGWAFELRGSVYRTTHALVQDLINLKFAHRDAFNRWRSACAPAMAERAGQLGKALAAKHLREAPAITNVHLASGPVLAAAEAFSEWLRTRDGLLKALEMEAAGMLLLAHQQADPARTLVLRGISDFGDERKSQTDRDSGGAFRHLAMFNATQLLWAMMYQGLLPRHAPVGGGPAGSRSSSTAGTPGELEAPATAAAWRRTVDQRLDGRLVLRDVDGAGLALDSVYVELELLVQLPTQVGVLRTDKGRCEEPRRTEADAEDEGREPGEQQMDLTAWLSETAPDASVLTIEGEVGSGKTELLARTARALAQATGTDAALPLWIDAKNLVNGRLARAVADWSAWTEDACRALIQHPSLKFAVFVDSLDEAGTSISETIAAIRGALGSRLHRLVLATRSAQRRALRDARVARLAPWNVHAIDRFLARWSRTDPEGVAQIQRERALGMLEEILANPLTATFCVLVAHEEPKALRNRTRLFHSIVMRIVSHWRRLRTRNDALYRRWETIIPWLGKLALERFRDHPSGLTTEFLRERLQEGSLDGADELLGDLTASYGVLIRTPHGYDFALRWLAEYLAGRSLRADVASIDEVAGHPWAFEPVRHAITGAPTDQMPAMIEALLADEDCDVALDAPTHLRRVQLAAVVAADLRDAFPKDFIDGLVQAIWRRLTDEGSSWIPSEMARAARSLARVGGPVWERLESPILAALLDARTDVAQWYGRQTAEQAAFWIDLLHHRDPKVRVTAIERLRPWVNDPETRDALLVALLDEGSRDRPALAAGLVLRGAIRDEHFAAAFPDLQRLLRDGKQIQLGAAALALLPGEAEPDQLALGLLGAHNAGADVSQAVRELANSPGGTAALERSPWRGGWRAAKHHPGPTKPEPDGVAPPVTGHVRWDLLRAIAPALHRLPQTTLRDLVHMHDHSHSLSHELEQIDAAVLPTVIDMMCDGYICAERIESVVRLARQHPDVGKALVARWRRIAETGMNETACIHFPGHGLTPLIEQGSEEAVDALLEWLPRSRLGQPQWANAGPPLSAAAFTHPRVLAAGRQYLQSRRPGQFPWDTEMLKRFAPAWHDIPEVWGSLVAPLQGERHAAAWRFVSDVCTHATLPEPFAATIARLAEEFIVRHDDPHQCSTAWHSAAPSALQFIEAHGLAPRVRSKLEWLAGLQGEPPCPQIQPMAVAMVISTVEAGKQILLAEAMVQRYTENTQSLNHLAPASLAALIRPIPQAWQQLLLGQLHTFDPTAIVLGSGKEHLRLLCALPARERGEVAMRLLQKRESIRLPWFKPLDNPTRRRCRPTDFLWQIAFEVGAA